MELFSKNLNKFNVQELKEIKKLIVKYLYYIDSWNS